MGTIGPGSRVKCVKRGIWRFDRDGSPAPGPKTGSIWTVYDMYESSHIHLTGWINKDQPFNVCEFVLVDGDAEIEKLREIARSPERILEPA